MIINNIKDTVEIDPCPKPFSDPLIYFIKVGIWVEKTKSNLVTKMTYLGMEVFQQNSLQDL